MVRTIFDYRMLLKLVPEVLRYNKLEQLEFRLEKILGFRNMQEKLEKLGIFTRVVITIDS